MDKIIKLGLYFARSMQSIVVFLIVMRGKSSQWETRTLWCLKDLLVECKYSTIPIQRRKQLKFKVQ